MPSTSSRSPNSTRLSPLQKAIFPAPEKAPDFESLSVLSSRGGQTKFDSNLADSIREFPALLLDGAAKTEALELTKKMKLKESTKPDQIQLKDAFKEQV